MLCREPALALPITLSAGEGNSLGVKSSKGRGGQEKNPDRDHFRLLGQSPQEERGNKLVVAVLGKSVAADTGGFVEALGSYLEVAFGEYTLDVEVRKIAHGGTGPQFTFYCNDLEKDENIIFQGVMPNEGKMVMKLASSLQARGMV